MMMMQGEEENKNWRGDASGTHMVHSCSRAQVFVQSHCARFYFWIRPGIFYIVTCRVKIALSHTCALPIYYGQIIKCQFYVYVYVTGREGDQRS